MLFDVKFSFCDYTHRNVSSASQTGQKVVDAIKSGELLTEEVNELLAKVRK